jgi:cyclic pyranopterin phosphate synthase
MFDNHNREINYLRVSLTDRCNLRCLYCMPKEGVSLLGHKDILSYEEITRIVTIAVKLGIMKVRLTGGEPLVRRGIVEFAANLNKIKGLNDITLTTNGILLENYAEALFNAGIRRINISLDSLDPQKYTDITRKGNLDNVLRGIKCAEHIGFSPIKINVVAIKGFNDDEILDFAKLTVDKPYQIRFIEFMPVGNPGLHTEFAYLSNDIIREIINDFSPLEPINGKRNKMDGPARLYRMKDAQGEIGLISAMSHEFCDSCNRLRLTADGYLRTCPMRAGCTEADLEHIITTAILNKPKRARIHCYDVQRKKCVRNMSSIGG